MGAKHPAFACSCEVLNRPAEYFGLDKARRQLVGELRGPVLEVGAGKGLNMRHYQPQAFVAATEPDPHMLTRAVSRAGFKIETLAMRAGGMMIRGDAVAV
ncbi:MAG: hypothetical protein ACREQB_11095 [Candidatus Binataceae bacterium]